MSSATIKLFQPHGDAERLRSAEASNWTGKTIVGLRTQFDSVLSRDRAVHTGVIPLAAGHLNAFPADVATGPAATVDGFKAGITRANNGLLRLGSDEHGSVKIINSSGEALDVIVDVVGYFR